MKHPVFVKATNTGECINYNSIAPERYKTGVIKTMLNRAYKICSSYESLHLEINRLKQLFTNNNFPMKLIDKEVDKFLSKKLCPNPPTTPATSPEPIALYYRNQMTSTYKQEELNLKRLIETHVKPTDERKIKLMIYYKNKKLRNMFIRNNPDYDSTDHHVVYQYECPSGECQPSKTYIGYTTTTLKQRLTTHAQNGSIATHSSTTHQNKIRTKEIMDHTTVLFRSTEKNELIIAEALLIKLKQPTINSQKEGETRILKIF